VILRRMIEIVMGMKNSQECFKNLKRELKWTIPIDVYILIEI